MFALMRFYFAKLESTDRALQGWGTLVHCKQCCQPFKAHTPGIASLWTSAQAMSLAVQAPCGSCQKIFQGAMKIWEERQVRWLSG